MEADERPTKLRKLDSHDEPSSEAASDKPLLPSVEVNGAVIPTAGDADTSKPDEPAGTANVADPPQEDRDDDADDSEGSAGVGDRQPQQPSAEPAQQQTGEPRSDQDPSKPMSKNQLKKLRKKQEWEAGREYRKLKRKQKLHEKRERKRAGREEAGEAQQHEQAGGGGAASQQAKEGHDGEVETGIQKPGLSAATAVTSKPNRRRPVQLPVTIIIDCGFDDLMIEKERISLGSQITRAYSDNWRAPFQAHLVISSWGGQLKQRFDTVLEKHYLNWRGVMFVEDDFVEAARRAEEVMKGPRGGKLLGALEKFADGGKDGDGDGDGDGNAEKEKEKPRDQHDANHLLLPPSDVTQSPQEKDKDQTGSESKTTEAPPSPNPVSAQKEDQPPVVSDYHSVPTSATTGTSAGEVVYLTSDSPDTLTELSPYSTYIVGGLVDKNRHKGICYKIATEKGIKTAKLPIGEYLDMQSRKVLATNHVVEIMIRWLECGDWGEAFLKVIPKRKGGRLKDQERAGQRERNGKSESVAGEGDDDDGNAEAELDNDNQRNGGEDQQAGS
ncbi:hypothetical protein A1O1_03077 [Capronia coronata CBS 617.96]|uniref:tRNA (guanine(9)-N1)-methyltransferase n=1 Tax=Capronia coronata CBS 617.96 TaxID=1182541 RepID=W9YYA4_9EURO|nr:uncharacterized protein A1O1_03077 [Capronia coronata CBS 617.96]EXJ94680.1 hypothetical protein A1O1_03077 [Capronia coronata CBS 617.96]